MRDYRIRILGVTEQAGNIAHKNQPLRLERNGGLRGCDVRIAIVNFSILAARGRADDRRDALRDALEQWRGVHADDFTDVTNINFLAEILLIVEPQLAASENIRSGKSFRLA